MSSDKTSFWLVTACLVDEADQLNSVAMTPDIVDHRLCRRLRLGHGGDVRSDHHPGMRPERMGRRQWLGIDDIEHSCSEPPPVQRLDQSSLIELRPAPHMEQSRTSGQLSEESRIENASRFVRQWQEANQNVGLPQKPASCPFAMKTRYALDVLFATAPIPPLGTETA